LTRHASLRQDDAFALWAGLLDQAGLIVTGTIDRTRAACLLAPLQSRRIAKLSLAGLAAACSSGQTARPSGALFALRGLVVRMDLE
jgi:hypothetical protein